MIIGAQLYTVRNFCKTTQELAESLKKVAEIGYTSVQVSGVCPYEGEWLAEQLKENGLVCAVTHTSADEIRSDPEKILQKHRTFGCSRIGIGSCPNGISDGTYDGFTEAFKPVAEYFAANGARFYYHNHWQEFVRSRKDGRRFLEKLCEDFPPEQLGIILDTYWVQFAGGDPCAWIGALKGRVDCVHLKDMIHAEKKHWMMPIGEGNLNWEGILAACEQAGTEYLLVEQDDCNGEDPFECLKRSYQYLNALGLR